METLLEEVLKFDNKEHFILHSEEKKTLACQLIDLVGHYIRSKDSEIKEAVETKDKNLPEIKKEIENLPLQTHEVIYGLRIALELSQLDEEIKLQAGLLMSLYNQNQPRGNHIPYLLIDLKDNQKNVIFLSRNGGK